MKTNTLFECVPLTPSGIPSKTTPSSMPSVKTCSLYGDRPLPIDSPTLVNGSWFSGISQTCDNRNSYCVLGTRENIYATTCRNPNSFATFGAVINKTPDKLTIITTTAMNCPSGTGGNKLFWKSTKDVECYICVSLPENASTETYSLRVTSTT